MLQYKIPDMVVVWYLQKVARSQALWHKDVSMA